MNSFHLLKGVSTVVAALGLALGLMAVPALANPPNAEGCHDHQDCLPDDGGGVLQRSQTFTVELIATVSDPDDAITTPDDCIGSSQRKQITDAVFPPGCGTIMVEDTNQALLILWLCQLNLNRRDRPDMNVTMYFTSGIGQVGGTLCVDVVYESLEVDAAFAACVDEEEGATCVTINGSGIALEKTLQPGKGDIVGGGPGGGFSVGTIVFTPVP